MTKITPSTSSLNSHCNIEIVENYHDEKGKTIAPANVEAVKKLGFDMDERFTKTISITLGLNIGGRTMNFSIANAILLRESVAALVSNVAISSDNIKVINKLDSSDYYKVAKDWFVISKKPIDDLEITFPNGETATLTAKQLKLSTFSSFVPVEYYVVTAYLKYIAGNEVTYFATNDFLKIGCNKVRSSVVLDYLDDIIANYNLIQEAIEKKEA